MACGFTGLRWLKDVEALTKKTAGWNSEFDIFDYRKWINMETVGADGCIAEIREFDHSIT